MFTKLRNIAVSHDIHLTASSVPSALEELIGSVHKKYNKEVVVLIDEYDSPYTKAFVKNKEVASEILDNSTRIL